MDDQGTSSPDPLASQRESLSRKLAAAQSTLTRALADLIRSGGDTASIAAQLQQISGLQGSIATADATKLLTLGGEVAAAVAQSQIVAQEARDQAATASAAQAGQSLSVAAATSRAALQDAMDSLAHTPLKFATPEEEADYRRREEERREYMTAQQAKHTPEGDLNAAGAGVGQMVDAKVHGASGPEFQQRLDALMATTEKLREAAKANGVSTEEFDRHLREDLRRIMKSKGLSDAEIDARFAATPDPLDAAKAYLRSDEDLAQVRDATQNINAKVAADPISNLGAHPITSHPDLNDALAKLSGAGLALTDHSATADFSHGVAVQGQGNSATRTT